MDKMKIIAIIIYLVVFIGGIALGWSIHSSIYKSQLADLQSENKTYKSEIAKLKAHSAMKITYNPREPRLYYNIIGVFNVSFTEISYWIRGNITNLTYYTINKVVLIPILRYPDGTLDIENIIWHDVVEVLEPYESKEFTIMCNVEENQPFDLLLIY